MTSVLTGSLLFFYRRIFKGGGKLSNMMGMGLTCLFTVVFFFNSTLAQGEDLLELYEMACQNDTRLAVAESSVGSSRARLDQSRSWIKPQVNLKLNYKENRGTYNYPSKNYSLTLTQSLLDYERWYAVDEGIADVLQSEANYEVAAQDLIMRVATAYFNLLGAEGDLGLARAEKQAVAQQLSHVRVRLAAGLSAITELYEVQAAYDLVVAQEVSAQSSLYNAREAVYEIVGKNVNDVIKLKGDIPLIEPKPRSISAWADLALQSSLVIIAQQAAVDSSSEALSRAEAGHLPTVDLLAGRIFSDTAGDKFGFKTTNSYVGVELEVPLYSGGYISAKVKEAGEKLVQEQAMLEQVRRAAVRDSRSAYLAVNADIALVKAYKQAVISTKAALSATKSELKAGTRTLLDVLDSQRGFYVAENDLSRARYHYLLSVIALKQAIGDLQVSDLELINSLLRGNVR